MAATPIGSPEFPVAPDKASLEEGLEFSPRFSAEGLITAVTVDQASGTVLMVAHMNALALERTIATGIVHYWSRSRAKLWKKGETSGAMQRVISIATDCDQDCLLVRVRPDQLADTCHTGRASCFYRELVLPEPTSEHLTPQTGDIVRIALTDAAEHQ